MLLSFPLLRLFQNLAVFSGMSPWPVVDMTKMTKRSFNKITLQLPLSDEP